jgi:hypothetical protein
MRTLRPLRLDSLEVNDAAARSSARLAGASSRTIEACLLAEVQLRRLFDVATDLGGEAELAAALRAELVPPLLS